MKSLRTLSKQKITKLVLVLGLSTSLLPAFTAPASADEPAPVACPEASTYQVSYQSYTTRNQVDFTHDASNPTSTIDTVSYATSIAHSAGVTVGGEYEFKALVAGAKISANVSYGYNNTKTITMSWGIPKGNWTVRAGSKWVASKGTRYWVNGTCALTNPVSTTANYTYSTWSDKIAR